jgi:hypothetical protein
VRKRGEKGDILLFMTEKQRGEKGDKKKGTFCFS